MTLKLFLFVFFSGKFQIAKEARECIQECVSEFISFITSEASERCQNEKRKTINGEDILYAMCTLGFDNYVDPLTLYLHKYRETTKTDRNIGSADVSFEDSGVNDFSEFVITIFLFWFSFATNSIPNLTNFEIARPV